MLQVSEKEISKGDWHMCLGAEDSAHELSQSLKRKPEGYPVLNFLAKTDLCTE